MKSTSIPVNVMMISWKINFFYISTGKKSEKIDFMLQKLGLKEGESIDHPWITKALEKAQQRVEGRNFDIRKTLLQFDDVMNDQRKVIFEQRLGVIKNQNIYNVVNDIGFLKAVLSKKNS